LRINNSGDEDIRILNPLLIDPCGATYHALFVNGHRELAQQEKRMTLAVEKTFAVIDGPVWTSAGMTAGIDPALVMVGTRVPRRRDNMTRFPATASIITTASEGSSNVRIGVMT
jgi:hypothetical protein